MRRKTADGAARDAAAQLDGGQNFFHAGDGCPGKRFAVKLYGESSVFFAVDLDSRSILASAAEEEFTEAKALTGIAGSGASKNKSAGAVAEQTSKFTGDPAGSERAAVNIGGDHEDRLGLPGADEGLRDGKGIEPAEASAARAPGAATFPRREANTKLRPERRIIFVRFAGGDDSTQRPASTGS